MCHTLQLVDIATGWSERVAVWGRSREQMVEGFRRVQARLPFAITHLHPDKGREFFNDHLIRDFGEEVTGLRLRLSQSRPYQQNGNRFVEQKTSPDVSGRAYLGYGRLDTLRHCAAVNARYDQLWVYDNLFPPALHLVGKEVVDGKLKRRWDTRRRRTSRRPPAAAAPQPPAPRAASAALSALRRDESTATAGGHLPRSRTAVAATSGQTGPRKGGGSLSVTFLNE